MISCANSVLFLPVYEHFKSLYGIDISENWSSLLPFSYTYTYYWLIGYIQRILLDFSRFCKCSLDFCD